MATLSYTRIISERHRNGRMPQVQEGFGSKLLARDVSFWYGPKQALFDINLAVPDPCARLVQTIIVDSGSNRDGSGQGEDQNLLECTYALPRGLTLTKQCPPSPVVPGGVLTFTGSVQNTGQVEIVNLTIVDDQPVPNTVVVANLTLAAGATFLFTNSYVVSANSAGMSGIALPSGECLVLRQNRPTAARVRIPSGTPSLSGPFQA